MLALSPDNIPRLHEVRLDRAVLAFAGALSLATGIAFGLVPAWRVARADLHAALKESGRGAASGAGWQRMRSGLVIAEIALAVVLLVSAGLLVRSLLRLHDVQPGFPWRIW